LGSFINTCGFFREIYSPPKIDLNWFIKDNE